MKTPMSQKQIYVLITQTVLTGIRTQDLLYCNNNFLFQIVGKRP